MRSFFLEGVLLIYLSSLKGNLKKIECKRFTGLSMEENAISEKLAKKIESTNPTNPFEEPVGKNPFEEEDEAENKVQISQAEATAEIRTVSPFHGLISRCFENHLNIFVDSQDK